MATFSAKERRTYQNICHLTEKGVLSLMKDALTSRYEKVVATPAFVYALGDIPVALVAHADTVFRLPPNIDNFFYDQEKDVIWNPDGAGADDRAGIFAILQILKKYKLKPHVIITTGEESGCIGANKLAIHTPEFPGDLKFMIQLDRRNHNDSVYYDCDNVKFEEFINGFGFKTEWGTLSDISVLAPTWEVAAVNLSVGYEDEHQEIERLHVNWLYETIDKVAQILEYVRDHEEVPIYDYIPTIYSWHYPAGYHGYSWFDDDYDDWENYAPGYGKCMICQHTERLENMIPVRYTFSNAKYNICLNCHSRLSNQIVWCKECNQGYYLTMDQAKKVIDVNNWVCEDCKNGKHHKGNSTVIQQSAPSVTESVYSPGSDGNGPDFHGMGEEQRVVLVKDQLSRIRDPRSCVF